MSLETGLRGRAEMVVAGQDLAAAIGSGDVPVLATTVLIALCERATVDAVAGHLEPGDTTVGVRVELEHTAALPVGAEVFATATLVQAAGTSLRFAVEAVSGGARVGVGEIRRVVVGRDDFMEGL